MLQSWLLPPMSRALRRTFTAHRHSSTLTLSVPFDTQDHDPPVRAHSYGGQDERQRRIQAFRISMDNSKEPSGVWSDYLSLVNTLGHDHLDISLHQEVLRKCTPPSHALRNISNRRLRYHQDPRSFLHESRFQTIIRNIRAIGSTPSIDDYHFILEQFAAVGHHVGAMQVYRELIQSSTPQKKTFGLCLQAIAHRLSLPKRPEEQEQEIQHARVMMSELLNGMEKYAVPFSSINLDFTIRIMKETSDIQGFESLMKLGYGIDIAHPDHPSLEVLGMRSADSNVSVPAQPLYFSVSALNAVVDLYGKTGNISRMVQAFEVLTVPLPQAQQHFFSSFEDDDDFGVSSSPSVMPPFVPSASPNTATFKILLRNLAKAGHFQLLRHYLLVAMELDRQVAYLTRLNLVSLRDISDVPSPTFAIGRSMVLSAFSHSNRRKRLAFMKWLTKKLPRIIKKKQKDLDFYKNFRKGLQKRKQWPTAPTTPSLDATSKISPSDQLRSSNAAPAFVPPPKSIWGYWRGYRWRIADVQSVVNADVADESDPESSGPPFKPLNLNLHIKLLENEIEDLVSIKERIGKIKSRMHDRIKDRLGRRVWAGKDIYFMTGGTRRGRISRLRWREMVNYKVKTTSDETGSVTVLRDVKSI